MRHKTEYERRSLGAGKRTTTGLLLLCAALVGAGTTWLVISNLDQESPAALEAASPTATVDEPVPVPQPSLAGSDVPSGKRDAEAKPTTGNAGVSADLAACTLFQGHESFVFDLVYLESDYLVSIDLDYSLYAWQPLSGTPDQSTSIDVALTYGLSSLDDKVALSTEEGLLYWLPEEGMPLNSGFPITRTHVRDFLPISDSSGLVITLDEKLWLWDGSSASQLYSHPYAEEQFAPALAIYWLGGEALVSFGDYFTSEIISLGSSPGTEAPMTIVSSLEHVSELGMLPSGKLVTSHFDGSIGIHDGSDTTRLVPTITSEPSEDDAATSLLVLGEDSILVGHFSGVVRHWEHVADEWVEVSSKVHRDIVTDLVLLPDGRVASSGGDADVKLWPAAEPPSLDECQPT